MQVAQHTCEKLQNLCPNQHIQLCHVDSFNLVSFWMTRNFKDIEPTAQVRISFSGRSKSCLTWSQSCSAIHTKKRQRSKFHTLHLCNYLNMLLMQQTFNRNSKELMDPLLRPKLIDINFTRLHLLLASSGYWNNVNHLFLSFRHGSWWHGKHHRVPAHRVKIRKWLTNHNCSLAEQSHSKLAQFPKLQNVKTFQSWILKAAF